jgi:hypothetical protein
MFILWCVIVGIMTFWITGIRMKGDSFGPLMDRFLGTFLGIVKPQQRTSSSGPQAALLSSRRSASSDYAGCPSCPPRRG